MGGAHTLIRHCSRFYIVCRMGGTHQDLPLQSFLYCLFPFVSYSHSQTLLKMCTQLNENILETVSLNALKNVFS